MPPLRSAVLRYALLAAVCGAMAVTPLVNHFRDGSTFGWPVFESREPTNSVPPHRQNKDYPLWYFVGRVVVEDGTLSERAGRPWLLYPTDPRESFPFMYPPFAALLLGAVSLLGPTGMVITLVLLNAASVAVAIELSVRMVAGTGNVSLWLRLIPAGLCLFFVNDMFMLGQPNLGLLCLVLGGLMLSGTDHTGKQIAGGALFALATAIKAFPAVVIVYLVWRRRWVAAGSMVGFCVLFFAAVPAVVRGPDRSLFEFVLWSDGMLFRQNEGGHGQRPEQSVGHSNQSLFGVANRLLRPGNAKARETRNEFERQAVAAPLTGFAAPAAAAVQPGSPGEPLAVNVVDLGYGGAMVGAMVIAGLLGVGFILLMPRRANRTRGTDAAEYGMLVVLMTVGTPYAFGYYFVWLLVPLTVITHHALSGGRWGWVFLAAVLGLFALGGAGAFGYVRPSAYGALFWAGIAALAGCGWAMLRARFPSPAGGEGLGVRGTGLPTTRTLT